MNLITHAAAATASASANARSQIAKPAVAHSRPVTAQASLAARKAAGKLVFANMVAMPMAAFENANLNAQW